MITKRIIPCLDVKDGRVVKGVNFAGLSDVSSPEVLSKFYSDSGADELVFYDITASAEGRALFTDILTKVASTIFIPLTVGGGINTVEDFDRVLNDRKAAPLRRRHPPGRQRQGAQGRAPCHLRLDGDRKAARHFRHVLCHAV